MCADKQVVVLRGHMDDEEVVAELARADVADVAQGDPASDLH